MGGTLDVATLAGTGLLAAGAVLAGLLGSVGRAQEMHRATAAREVRASRGRDEALTLAGWLVTLFLLLVGALWLAEPLALAPALVLGWTVRREGVARALSRLDLQPLSELKFAAVLGLLSVAAALAHLWATHPPPGVAPGLGGLARCVGLPYAGASCALVAAMLAGGRAQDRRRLRRRAALGALARARAVHAVPSWAQAR